MREREREGEIDGRKVAGGSVEDHLFSIIDHTVNPTSITKVTLILVTVSEILHL